MIRRISGLRLLVSVVFRRVAIPVCLMILSPVGFAQSAAGAFEASFADLNGDRSAWLTWPTEPGWGYSVESSDQVQIDPNTGEITFAPGTGVAEPMGYSYGTGSLQAFYAVPPPPPGAIGTPDPRPFRILSVITLYSNAQYQRNTGAGRLSG